FPALPPWPALVRHAPAPLIDSPRCRPNLQVIRERPCPLPPAEQPAERQPNYARNQKASTRIATYLIFEVGFQTLRLHSIHAVSRASQQTGSPMPQGRHFRRLTRSISLLMKRLRRRL